MSLRCLKEPSFSVPKHVNICFNCGIRNMNVNQLHTRIRRPGLVNQHVSYDILNRDTFHL